MLRVEIEVYPDERIVPSGIRHYDFHEEVRIEFDLQDNFSQAAQPVKVMYVIDKASGEKLGWFPFNRVLAVNVIPPEQLEKENA